MTIENTTKPIIDANALEAMAKQRPEEKFLKGSGVLKLIQAIRDLERANRELRAQQTAPSAAAATEVKNLRKALQFYADKDHFNIADEGAWDTVSGEPQNYWCDEEGTATVEDGTIARLALAGHQIKFDADEAPQPSPTPQLPAPTEQQAYDMGAKGAPATDAERLLFEAWMRGHCWALCATWDGKCYRSDSEQNGNIDPRAMNTRQLWAAWRDRAALSAQQGGA